MCSSGNPFLCCGKSNSVRWSPFTSLIQLSADPASPAATRDPDIERPAAAGLSMSGSRVAAGEAGSADSWIKDVKGDHRTLFDFPQHKNGFPLLHILNYLNTYATAFKTTPGQVGAVGTFYAVGRQASIP